MLLNRDSTLILDSFKLVGIDTMTARSALFRENVVFLKRVNDEKSYVGSEIDSINRLYAVADSAKPVGYRVIYQVTIRKPGKFLVMDSIAYAISPAMQIEDWDRNVSKAVDSLAVGKHPLSVEYRRAGQGPQNAQSPRIIPLYPDSIPNSRPGPDQEKSEVNGDGILIISKVSQPALTIYSPEPGKGNGTAVVICPGGGYWVEAADLEGTAFAKRFAKEGVLGIVLKYRIPSDETMVDRSIGALQDAQQAIKVVREHAGEWKIDPKRIGIMGFSAGGHLAAMEATHFDKVLIPDAAHTSVRPDFVILGYPVISCVDSSRHTGSCEQLIGKNPSAQRQREYSNELQVTDATPPAFLVHASDDTGVPVENSILFYHALVRHHVPVEMHLYEHSGHGFGMHLKNTQEDWMGRCFHWMQANGWMP